MVEAALFCGLVIPRYIQSRSIYADCIAVHNAYSTSLNQRAITILQNDHVSSVCHDGGNIGSYEILSVAEPYDKW